MSPLTNKEKQAEFKKRQRERGLVQVTLWVPERDKGKAREYAGKLIRIFERG